MLNYLKHNSFSTFTLLIFFLLIISGCSNYFDADKKETQGTSNPDATEVLTLDPNADIFKYNDLIYQTNIDWVEEKKLTKNKEIGEIKKKNQNGENFSNGTANKLPVGAKIYTTKEENDMFLIIESEGKTKKYYALVEG